MTSSTYSSDHSHWGWGQADRLLPAPQRLALAQQVAALLGADATALDVREPVALADVTLPAARPLDVPAALAGIVATDDATRIYHTYGRAWPEMWRGFGGDFEDAPDAVALPSNDEELEALLAWATAQQVVLVPRGGGTSVCGGVWLSASDETRPRVVLSLRRMNQVLAVDLRDGVAHIQAGATGPELQQQLAPHGVQLRHYPQSWEYATLGGWIVTRAGGHFATRYTHIDDLLVGVRMRTPVGVWETRRLPASGAGPDPRGLILGSEGILGVVTDAWVRVHSRPTYRSNATVRFADMATAVTAVRRIAQSGLTPANCRLLDPREAMLNFVDDQGRAVLVLAFESSDAAHEQAAEEAVRLAVELGGLADGPPRHKRPPAAAATPHDSTQTIPITAPKGDDAAGTWRQAFFDGPYLQTNLLTAGIVADTFETCCSWSQFDGLHRAVRTAVREAASQFGLQASVSCRFTHVYPDGPAPYWTWLVAAGHDQAHAVWSAVKTAASATLIAHGATITHHHAVGRIHRPAWEAERPALFAQALAACKTTLDPAGVLNPGVLLAAATRPDGQ